MIASRVPWLLVGLVSAAGACSDADESETSERSSASAGGEGAGAGGAGLSAGGAAGQGGAAAVACDVEGTAGVCVDVADCTNAGVSIPGYCPGPSGVQCCVHDAVACDPDAHVLPNGGLVEAPGIGGCPVGMARVEDFCVDRFEASLVAQDGTPWSPFFNPGTTEVRAVSLEGAVPQGYVSGIQAASACERAGKRLCTDAEWLRACGGPGATTYPYGDTDEPGVCNDARAVHPAVEYFGTTDESIYSMLDNACLDQLPDSLDRTGANPGCVTAEGIFDMMGNLHEWTADPAGTFRGGYFVDTKLNGPGCLYVTTAHDTSHWDYSTGFRCCADPT